MVLQIRVIFHQTFRVIQAVGIRGPIFGHGTWQMVESLDTEQLTIHIYSSIQVHLLRVRVVVTCTIVGIRVLGLVVNRIGTQVTVVIIYSCPKRGTIWRGNIMGRRVSLNGTATVSRERHLKEQCRRGVV